VKFDVWLGQMSQQLTHSAPAINFLTLNGEGMFGERGRLLKELELSQQRTSVRQKMINYFIKFGFMVSSQSVLDKKKAYCLNKPEQNF